MIIIRKFKNPYNEANKNTIAEFYYSKRKLIKINSENFIAELTICACIRK